MAWRGMSSQKRWIGRAAGSVVLVGAFTLLAGGAAHASVTVETITCIIKVNDPHGSVHVTGNVNVTSTVQCTEPVARIQQETVLHWLPSSGHGGPIESVSNKSYIGTNDAVPCAGHAPGSFYGGAVTTVTFPPSFTPQSATDITIGRTIAVNCTGGAQVVGPVVAGAPEDLSEDTFTVVATSGQNQ